MGHIKLKVRGGGLFLKFKDSTHSKTGSELDMALVPLNDPKLPGEFGLKLVRESAVEGIISYLMGDTLPVRELSKNDTARIDAINSVVIRKVREPFITSLFARRPYARKASDYVKAGKFNLYHAGYESLDPSLELFVDQIKKILPVGGSVKMLNDILKTEKVIANKNSKNPEALKEELVIPLIPTIEAAKTKMSEKIVEYLKQVKEDRSKYLPTLVRLISQVESDLTTDEEFLKKFKAQKASKFSAFTAPDQERHWVKSEVSEIAEGAPESVACVDFDIYIKNPSEEAIERFINGPQVASWGEGGVVSVEYHLDSMTPPELYSGSDEIIIEVGMVRKALGGPKEFPYYPWEQERINREKKLEEERKAQIKEAKLAAKAAKKPKKEGGKKASGKKKVA